ncbi:GNAT family N-acetyltransferase [Paenibacillus sp. A14]
MTEKDPLVISKAFEEQGWHKPVELYQKYVEEQHRGERVALVAELGGEFAGYVNVIWNSYYDYFRECNIPEVSDFNVLQKYRRRGIGSKLMDKAEEIIRERSRVAGIGVGLFSDYGNAQVLYVKRGYIPDGRGIHNGERYLKYGDSIVVDDDIVLYFKKLLKI